MFFISTRHRWFLWHLACALGVLYDLRWKDGLVMAIGRSQEIITSYMFFTSCNFVLEIMSHKISKSIRRNCRPVTIDKTTMTTLELLSSKKQISKTSESNTSRHKPSNRLESTAGEMRPVRCGPKEKKATRRKQRRRWFYQTLAAADRDTTGGPQQVLRPTPGRQLSSTGTASQEVTRSSRRWNSHIEDSNISEEDMERRRRFIEALSTFRQLVEAETEAEGLSGRPCPLLGRMWPPGMSQRVSAGHPSGQAAPRIAVLTSKSSGSDYRSWPSTLVRHKEHYSSTEPSAQLLPRQTAFNVLEQPKRCHLTIR